MSMNRMANTVIKNRNDQEKIDEQRRIKYEEEKERQSSLEE